KFTDEMEHLLSPQRHLDTLNAPIIVAYGTLESPEFQRQSRDFAAAVQAAGKPVQLLVGEGYNHFEIIETLGNPYGLLGRAVLEQMQLTKTYPGQGRAPPTSVPDPAPNIGLQATANSLRSYLAAAIGGA